VRVLRAALQPTGKASGQVNGFIFTRKNLGAVMLAVTTNDTVLTRKYKQAAHHGSRNNTTKYNRADELPAAVKPGEVADGSRTRPAPAGSRLVRRT
jgi:hypothetical protein